MSRKSKLPMSGAPPPHKNSCSRVARTAHVYYIMFLLTNPNVGLVIHPAPQPVYYAKVPAFFMKP